MFETLRRRGKGKIRDSGILEGGFLLIFALTFSAVEGSELYIYYRSAQWRVADCTVNAFEILPSRGKPESEGHPSISYQFTADDGIIYNGSRFHFFADLFSKEEIKHFENVFQPGKHFGCLYNPANPRESVARRSLPPAYVLIIGNILLAICYLFAALLIFFGGKN